jgi:hypothetical protein
VVAPSLAVADLLGDAALFKLAQRVPDRGKGDRHPVIALDGAAYLGRAQGARGRREQHLLDHFGIGAALRPLFAGASPARRRGTGRSCRSSAAATRRCRSGARRCVGGSPSAAGAPSPLWRRSALGAWRRFTGEVAHGLHRGGIPGRESLAPHRFDLVLKRVQCRSGHCWLSPRLARHPYHIRNLCSRPSRAAARHKGASGGLGSPAPSLRAWLRRSACDRTDRRDAAAARLRAWRENERGCKRGLPLALLIRDFPHGRDAHEFAVIGKIAA